MIDTQPQLRLISSEVIAYNELTTRLHLHRKPVRNAKPHGGYLLFCQMMGLVICFCSSITILYSFFYHGLYTHTDIQWEETSVQFFFLFSLSVQGECFPQKRRAYGSKVKVLCCEISLSLYLFLHLVHLVLPLLSSPRLVTFAGPLVEL